jgi:glycosyltransferase involved in cell wall biosynthesis
MKVLHTCLSESWGGMEMYSLQTAQLLINSGIEIEVDLLCINGSRLHLEAVKQNIPVRTSLYRNQLSLGAILSFSSLLKRNNYDLVHAEASKDLWLITPALHIAKSKIPLLLSKHVGSFIVKKDFLHRYIYNRVTLALAISEVIKRNLVDTTPLPADKIVLLHNAIDAAKFSPQNADGLKIRNEFGIKEDDLVLGMTARFSPGKGHEEFLFAAKELSKKNDNLKFIIVGEPSKGEDSYGVEIKSLAQEYGITDKIIFTGYRTDIPDILAAMDIFVFPSHAEAFGLSLTEAMSMEKPSVCSRSDGVLDIAIDGVTSYLFEKQNKQDLTEKLDKLISNPRTRKEFGTASRKRVLNNFDTGIFTNNLINIYKEVLKK